VIDTSLIQSVVEAWRQDQEHPARRRVTRPLPSASLLGEFIGAAFFASIKQEEGRPLSFSAVLLSQSEAALPSGRYLSEILCLESPVPFTASLIPKLAPALDPRHSSLAVTQHPDSLCCWGILSYRPTVDTFTHVPVGVEDVYYSRPDYFTVSSTSPGSLTFSRGNSMLGRYVSGHFVPATPTLFTTISLGKHLKRLIEKTEAGKDHGDLYWQYAQKAIEVLLGETSRRGHGATIVFLDAYSPDAATLRYSGGHVLNGKQRLGARIERCVDKSDILRHVAWGKLAFETLQRVAQLATIDGALVINSKFDVLTFGAKLTAEPWKGATKIGPDGWGIWTGRRFDLSQYGTRHQSAVDFAGACADCVVFVVSQDGPIRAFVREGDSTVLCWLDCSASMFV
jgi:hypothetical protein